MDRNKVLLIGGALVLVLFLAYLPAAFCLANDRWKRNRSRNHHERRGGKDCGELVLPAAAWLHAA